MRTPSFWHRPNVVAAALAPLGILYRLGATVDRLTTTPRRAPVPVIAVGNVVAGGAGKTPVTLALTQQVHTLGEMPHLLTRGYGGTIGTPQRVQPQSDWHVVGDEALLLAAAAPTWAGRARVVASHMAAGAGASLVIADDALQHYRLHHDIAFLVIDGAYGLGNGRLLPAGPLRETFASALARCHAVVLLGNDAQGLTDHISPPVFRATLEPKGDIAALAQGRWIAFAGLARPQKFFDMLVGLGTTLDSAIALADHYAYTPRDIEALIAKAHAKQCRLVTTAKDAVKIPQAYRSAITVMDVTCRFADEPGLREWLRVRLAQARA